MTLVAHYPLQEDSGGTAFDLAGSNDGTVNGATQGASGLIGTTAYDFNGSGDYVEVTSLNDDSGKDFTVSAWVNPDAFPNNINYIFAREGKDSGIILRVDSSGVPEAFVHDGSFKSVTGTGLSTGSWTFIVFRCNNNTEIELYQNAVSRGTTAIGDRNKDTSDFAAQIGARQIGPTSPYEKYWAGRIADVRLYDRALSPTSIQYLYQSVTDQASISTEEKIL